MFAKLVAELKVIVAEIKSPFSYIHDKAVEALAEVHKEVEALKARIDAIEAHVGIFWVDAEYYERLDEVCAQPITPQYYMENGAGEKVIATKEDLANPELVHAKVWVKHSDDSFSEVERV